MSSDRSLTVRNVVDAYLGSALARISALLVLIAGVFIRTVLLPNQPPAPYRIDIDVYRTGARVLLDGGNIYNDLPGLSQGAELPFTYPPIAAILFVIFAIMPLWAASALLTVASLAALGGTLFLALKAATRRTASEVVWLTVLVTGLGLWLSPVRETLDFGQINLVLMVMVAIDVTVGRGKWWGGALTGLAVAIKLTPIVFFLYFLLRRDWRAGITAAVSFLAFTAIGHLVMPSASTQYWRQTLMETDRIGDHAYAANQSINGLLHRFGIDSGLVWLVASLAAGLFTGWVAWRCLKHQQPFAALLAVAASSLLCSPVSWTHHWVWVVPMIVLFLLWGSALWWALACVGVLVFSVAPHKLLPSRDQVELGWTTLQHLVGNATLLWLMLALICLLVKVPDARATQGARR